MSFTSVMSRHWAAEDWLAAGVLDPLAEINAQCIELLVGMADGESGGLPVLQHLVPLWRSLGPEARQRLAACPYLLVDAGFSDASRWQLLSQHRVNDQPHAWRAGCFRGERATAFVRRVLVYAWHLARSNNSVARIALGMSPACVEMISSLGLRELDGVCEQYPGWVRPRWEAQPLIWRQMLAAAARDDGPALQQASLRGIQLLAAAAASPAVR